MEQIGLDRLTGLIAFARAASLGSYTAAARALGISPSAVSKSVQRLERQLGLRLFHRTTRSLTLTVEGRDLHERVLRLLHDADEIGQVALAARSEPTGELRVAAAMPIGLHLIAPALPRFRARYPKILVDLRLTDGITDLIAEGVDVAIRVGEFADSRLICTDLAPNLICAFASPAYLAQKGTPSHPSDLVHHECVGFRFQSSGKRLRWPFAQSGDVLELMPDAWVVTDSSDAVAAIVAAGGGIGLSPVFIAAAYVARGELIPVLQEHAVRRSTIRAFWPESRRGSPNVRAFLKFFVEVCADAFSASNLSTGWAAPVEAQTSATVELADDSGRI